ncbi:thiamine diphosphokinase [Falsigemmobacter faecalis]|uniref:Thiamine diphosphokinase n=1 Tax=Falsigemmobacter faecalis TaxID=2488730 RepID=A0A3P3DH14_9RHOB|nr:thiamine diphosphokinase [Falsigemmobacter faecalis]RRH73567.1 thiamine diphosphokinase [Falsigemmobacter faecalis]
METKLVESLHGITLIGGGPVQPALMTEALALAPTVVAADGGADRAIKLGITPHAVIGDLDSLSRAARQRFADRLHRIPEQSSTDFDKALRHISAPFCLCLGFSGGRVDHALAVFNCLVQRPGRRALILSPSDVVFAAPAQTEIRLSLPPRCRVSLFPMAAVTGTSAGLRWPIEGISFSPAGAIGTSNIATAPEVSLRFDQPGMLVILPRAQLRAALSALGTEHVRGK